MCDREEGKEKKERMGEQLAHSPSFPLSPQPNRYKIQILAMSNGCGSIESVQRS